MQKRLFASVLFCSLLGVAIGLSLACKQTPDTAYSLSERLDMKIQSQKITTTYKEKEYLRALQLLQELEGKYPAASEVRVLQQQWPNLPSLAIREEVDRPAQKLAAKVKADAFNGNKEDRSLTPEEKTALKEQRLTDAYSRTMQANYPTLYNSVEYIAARNSINVLVNDNWNALPPEAKQDVFKQAVVLWSAASQALAIPVNYDSLQITMLYGATHTKAASWNGQEGYALY